MSDTTHQRRSAWPLVAGFAVLAVLIAAAGYVIWRQQAQSIQQRADSALVAVGKLKSNQIVSWLGERHGDAEILHGDPLVAAATADLLAGRRATTARADLQTLLETYRRTLGYADVVMTAPDGAVLLGAPQAPPSLGARNKALVARAAATGSVQSSDLYLDAAGNPRLEFVAPILSPKGDGQAIAAVTLGADPHTYLYPLIQTWPVPSRSGETLLAERHGSRVLFLNDLRFREGAALKLTSPADAARLPAAMAVRGRTGVVQGLDYRGVRVLAALQRVPGTSWYIVAKEDTGEVLGAVRTRGWTTGAVALVMVALAGAGALLLWRLREGQVSAAIRESEQKYRTLIENLSSGVVVHAPDTRILLSNLRAGELLGLSADQMQGKTAMDPHWRFLSHDAEPLPLERYPVNQVLASGEALTDLVVGVCRSEGAAQVWLLCNGYPERDEHGELVQIVITFADITERKRAEEALRVASLYARNLIETSLDPLVTISAAGKITDVNAATEKVTGRSRETLIDSDFADYFTAPEMARAGYQKAFSAGHVIDYPLAIRHSSGAITEVLYNASVYRDEHGEVLGVFAAARDITERKRAEDEVRRLNTDLEQRVLDRTAQLDAANKELEAFAYSVSHDLRAPLRHISGFSALLAERVGDDLDEKSSHYVDTISRSVREMGVLIDDLLQFSRTGRAELQIEHVDMDATLAEALEPLRRETEDREIEWVIGPLPAVVGDHALLRQVWANLLGNAVKYTRGRAPARIEVGARDGGEVNEELFWVRDNGVGFDMQYAHKLFGVFQRLHSSAEFEGTGIGLANVKRIINRLGGRVWAEGEVDHGATFYFSLPRRKDTPS